MPSETVTVPLTIARKSVVAQTAGLLKAYQRQQVEEELRQAAEVAISEEVVENRGGQTATTGRKGRPTLTALQGLNPKAQV